MAAKRPKFKVGQIIVGIHCSDYVSRIKKIRRDAEDDFIYTDADENEWTAYDLRPLTARERGK